MPERLFFVWRLLATGFCFGLFGLSGLLLGFVWFPLQNLFIRQRQRRTRLARATIQAAFRIFIGLMQQLRVLRYEVTGLTSLNREGLLILANHPTLIDTVFLMALTKNAVGLLKADLQNNFFTRGVVRATGYIFNDQGMDLIDACNSALNSGGNLILFPEGTRTAPDGSMHLKRGAANIALRTQHNITPVIIRCQPRTLGKGEHWWWIPPTTAQFTIEVKEDIEIAQFLNEPGGDSVAARHLTAFLLSYFTEELQRHA